MTRDELRDLLALQFEQVPNPLGLSAEILWIDATHFYVALVHNEEDPIISNFFRAHVDSNSLQSRLYYDPRYDRGSWERWFSERLRIFNRYLSARIRDFLHTQQQEIF